MTSRAIGRERRGVLMTASSRRPAWRDEIKQEATDVLKKASQQEWSELISGLEEEKLKVSGGGAALEDAQEKRRSSVAYDDISMSECSESESESEDEAEMAKGNVTASLKEARRAPGPAKKGSVAAESAPLMSEAEVLAMMKKERSGVQDAGPAPVASTAAGEEEMSEEKRLRLFAAKGDEEDEKAKGKKRGGGGCGSKKKKKREREADAANDESGQPRPKRKKKEEDPDRWQVMLLEGDDKAKKIDTTRLVSYHDFDASAGMQYSKDKAPAGDEVVRDFRSSSLYEDLYEDDG